MRERIKEIEQFLKDYDLGWREECYTIAKKTVEDAKEDLLE